MTVRADLIQDIRSQHPEAVVIVGDLVFSAGSSDEWDFFDQAMEPIQATILPVMGNHDYRCFLFLLCWHDSVPGHVSSRFGWLTEKTHYAVRIGNLELVMLDSERNLASQGSWLASQLLRMERSGIRGAIVFVHRPSHTNSSVVNPDDSVRQHVLQTLTMAAKRRRLALVLVSGHAHGYERFQQGDVPIFVSAGGGGPRQRRSAEARFEEVSPIDNCAPDAKGRIYRPYNFLVITEQEDSIQVEARGRCPEWSEVRSLEAAMEFPFPTP